MAWRWIERAGRFLSETADRLLSAAGLRRGTDLALRGSPVTDYAASLASDAMDVGAWQQAMREEIKRNYVQQYIAGRGGRDMMTQADWGSVGGMVREQYMYLDKFADEVARGNLTEGQIAHRSRMYVNSSREAFERAQERAALVANRREVRWVLGVAEHCPDCLDLARLGWRRVADDPFGGAYPGSGDTQCLTNCQCHLEYREIDSS